MFLFRGIILLLLLLILNFNLYCQNDNLKQKFNNYLMSFPDITSLFVVNCDTLGDSNYSHILDINEEYIIFLNFLSGPMPIIPIGKYQTKSNIIVTIIGTAAANYVPCIVTYNDEGKMIDVKDLSSYMCGAGYNYRCISYLIINENEIYILFIEKEENYEKKIMKKFKLSKNGKIKEKNVDI